MMLLAILYNDPTQFAVIDSFLTEEDFTLVEHRLLFKIFAHLSQTYTTTIGKEHVLSGVKELDIDEDTFMDATENGSYLDKILYYCPEDEDPVDWLIKIKQESYKRNGIEEMKRLQGYLNQTQDPLEEIIERVEDTIMQVGEESNKSKKVSHQIFENAREIIMGLAEDPVIGININMPLWQKAVGSLRNKTVHFVVAYTGSGKSQFALRAAMEACRDKPVLYCDSEMDEEIAVVRGFCIIHGIPYDYIEYGLWNKPEGALAAMGYEPKQIANIQRCAKVLQDKANWDRFDRTYRKNFHYLNINGTSVTKSLPQIRRWLMTYLRDRDLDSRQADCLVIIDQIKLTDAAELRDAKLQEFQFLGIEMSNLHDFAHKWNIPVLAMGQTNAYGEVQGAKRLKDTASSVTMMITKDREALGKDMEGNVKLIVDKSRRGGLPEHAYINILFNRDRGQIRELNIGGIETNDRRQASEPEGDGEDRTDPDPNGNTDSDDDDWTGG
jgi:replicative DNA helicase